MSNWQEVESIIRRLAENSGKLRAKIEEGDLQEATKLMGSRVALIEALREAGKAKVSGISSDVVNEMGILVKSIENDVSEAAEDIRARLASLMKELGSMTGAKKIAAYAAMRLPENHTAQFAEPGKINGGSNGY